MALPGSFADHGEEFVLTEAQLGGERLVLHEQSEFDAGVTNDMTVARERFGKQRADARLQGREGTCPREDAAEVPGVTVARAIRGEQRLAVVRGAGASSQ